MDKKTKLFLNTLKLLLLLFFFNGDFNAKYIQDIMTKTLQTNRIHQTGETHQQD